MKPMRRSKRNLPLPMGPIHPDPGDGLGPYVEIPLSRGLVARASPEDHVRVANANWHACKSCNTYYAYSGVAVLGTRRMMHRELANAEPGFEVDHKNHNGIDNRRANLRVCTRHQNQQNRSKRRRKGTETTSRFIGVSRAPGRGDWVVQIQTNGTHRVIGRSWDEEEAARMYDSAARERGEFAVLNFPEEK